MTNISDNPDAATTSPTGCPISAKAAQFDVFGRDFQVNPAEALRWSRDKEPVFYNHLRKIFFSKKLLILISILLDLEMNLLLIWYPAME